MGVAEGDIDAQLVGQALLAPVAEAPEEVIGVDHLRVVETLTVARLHTDTLIFRERSRQEKGRLKTV